MPLLNRKRKKGKGRQKENKSSSFFPPATLRRNARKHERSVNKLVEYKSEMRNAEMVAVSIEIPAASYHLRWKGNTPQ